jgi:tetratricopeptide (TPR) repeat protein/TolB-like protein
MTERETKRSFLSPARWQELEPLLDAALVLSSERRATFIDEACGADAAMRQELMQMLTAYERLALADPLLQGPAAERFASLWEEPEEAARLRVALADRYTLEGETGRGGMAVVYRARDLRHRRPVALKVLRAMLSGQGPARFRREIALAANLQHPHILPVFDSGEGAGRLWYTMPFVDGESLGARLRRERRFEIPEAVRLLREIADALDYAHARGVVHRDLKPDNVLLSGGHAVIADFGVAKAIVAATRGTDDAGGDETTTGVGVSVGTPAYMAPEQAAADPAVDHRADLYALGVIAYQLLAGVTPFTGTTPQALFAAHLAERPAPVSTHRSDVSPGLERLVMRLLEKGAADRPQSAAEVLAEVDALDTSAQAARASADGAPVPPTRVWRLRPRWLAAVAVIAVVAGGAAWYVRAGTADPIARRVLVVPLQNQTGDSTLAPLGRMAAEWIAQGLATIDSFAVSSELAESPSGGETGLKAAAAEYRAATVVSGAYYMEGDSIRLQPTVTDVAGWKLLPGVRAVRASRSNPTATLDTVAQRVMAVIARARDPRIIGWDIGAPPPTYEAMHQFLSGVDVFAAGDTKEAMRYWERAATLDSFYAQPVLHLIIGHTLMGEDSVANELLLRLERRRDSLMPFDRAMLDLNRAYFEGNSEAQLAAAQRMAGATPGAPLPYWFIGIGAFVLNRPRQSLTALQRVPFEDGKWSTGTMAAERWGLVTNGYHMLSEHKTEIREARTAESLVPGNRDILWYELRALAALGQLDTLSPKLEDLEGPPQVPEDPATKRNNTFVGGGLVAGATVPALLVSLAQELHAHQHDAEARAVLRRAISWIHAPSPDERRLETSRFELMQAHYFLAEYDTADSLLTLLETENPADWRYLAYRGLAAARQGRRAEAVRTAERLDSLEVDPPARIRSLVGRSLTTLARAAIAAQLGDTTVAMARLEQAVAEGAHNYLILHMDWDLTPLRRQPRFQQLIKPKG